MQYRKPKHFIFQRIDQRLEGYPAFPYPLGQGGLRNGQTGAAEHRFLTVERQMIEVLGNQHLREQSGRRDAFVDPLLDQPGTGELPLLTPMSEVAGRMAVQEGAKYLEKIHGGRGVLLGGVPGVPPAKVVIIGGGTVGINAAKMAAGLGASVIILDVSLERLRYLDDVLPANVRTIYSNRFNILDAIERADLVIGAVLLPGAKAPHLVTRADLRRMQPGAVIVDVAVDQGGCVETIRPTTHDDPTYMVDGILHYAVANMPGGVPRTSTLALTNATLPYGLRLAKKGWKAACRDDRALALGLNVIDGRIVYPGVADAFGFVPLPPGYFVFLVVCLLAVAPRWSIPARFLLPPIALNAAVIGLGCALALSGLPPVVTAISCLALALGVLARGAFALDLLLALLAFWHVRAHWAALAGLACAAGVAMFVYRMPPALTLASAGYGAAFGLFPIGWIVLNAIFVYDVSVTTGQFDALKRHIAGVSADRRIQALLIAFSFGAFIEGAAGFGTPVAISAAMLIGLGFKPLQAAGLALIGNTAPVAYGALGTPIIALARVTGLIHAVGGLAVVAHLGGQGSEDNVRRFRDQGIDGIEVRHPSHDASDERRLGAIAERLDLAVTGGSDWHGDSDHGSSHSELGGMDVPAAWLDALESRRGR